MPSHQERVKRNYCEHRFRATADATEWTCRECGQTKPFEDDDEYMTNPAQPFDTSCDHGDETTARSMVRCDCGCGNMMFAEDMK